MSVKIRGLIRIQNTRWSFFPVQVRYSNTMPDWVLEKHRKSPLNNTLVEERHPKTEAPRHFKYVFPEFLPDTIQYYRDPIREKLERRDMLKRRDVIEIPEFYVGSFIAVTVSERSSSDRKHRFVGICTERGGVGTRAWLTLRNHLHGQGVEITYEMYSPIILEIECLKLEKRLDEQMPYLKDAPPEYSMVPFDHPKIPHPPGLPIPVNDTKVKMNPYPWFSRWELHYFNGMDASESNIWPKRIKRAQLKENVKPWQKYDLMKWYRESIDDDTTRYIMKDVQAGLKRRPQPEESEQ